MKKERVKFYNRSDYFYSYMLNLAIEKVKTYDETKEYSLEEVLELYNIVKYIDDDAKSLLKNEEDKAIFSAETKIKFMQTIGSFFNNLDNSSIVELKIDSMAGYSEDFLELFEKFNVFEHINYEEFFIVLKNLRIPDYYVYHQKKIVHYYDKQLKFRLLNDDLSFDLLFEKYLSTDNKKELFIPSSLNKKDKETITINYIKSQYAHINILEIIISLPVFDDFSISDDTRILAKDRYDELLKKFFDEKEDGGLHTDIQVGFSDNLVDEYELENTANKLSLIISKKWISKNLDYPTLLNNLIYVLGLTDSQMRISNISKPNSMSTLTRVLSDRKLKNFYFFGYEFELINKFTQISVAAYRDYLQSAHNICLEEVVQYFFEKYLPGEFSLNDFSVNMPSKESSYLEKCRTICCEFESLLKQYDSLVKYGKVRHDIIEISSRPVAIETVRSFVENKYIYPQMDKCNAAMYWLFSDQTLLTYFGNNKERREYDNFYKLLLNEKININEYEEHQKGDLRYLIDEKIIDIDKDGYIFFNNIKEVRFIYDLYLNEFALYNTYAKLGYEDIIKKFLEKGWITIGSSLLAKQECSYINFYLNKQKYFNGYDLRNKYLHGTQRKQGQDSELHKLNYNILLTLYLLIVIKINDDLCQYKELTHKEKDKK